MKQKILITGGTGFLGRSLGATLKDEYEIILSGRNGKQNALAQEVSGCRVLPLDVCRIESVRDAVVEVAPDIVIHAAATKYVDLAERQPMECVDVNVLGSQNVARVARDRGIPVVIGISTDKASPPVRNTYGLTKALMERMFCSLNDTAATRFTCVRYGNVAWSTGSVLPIWQTMHRTTGEIQTTGPEMRRFFFTVDEAVALVRAALDNLDRVAGKVLSRKMKSVQMSDLLDLWIRIYGGGWKRIEGRPGEREDEFLIGDLEIAHTSELTLSGLPHYLIAFNEKVEKPVAEAVSSATVERLSESEMRRLLEAAPIEHASLR